MTETNTIKAVELVRRIRDEQAKSLAGKSDSEVIEFYRRHGELVREDVKKTVALGFLTRRVVSGQLQEDNLDP